MDTVINALEQVGVVPVVTIDDVASAEPLGEALMAGGLPCAEITFRTPAAAAALQEIVKAFPEMWVGAGTVRAVAQAESAAEVGAKFIVMPGFDPIIVDWCIANHIPVIPGIVTPTELQQAAAKGLKVLKFFPAEAYGGVKTLKAIAGPFPDIRFVPTGGIGPDNLADYLQLPSVVACGGSWLVDRQLLIDGNFAEIRKRTTDAVAAVHAART